MDPVFAKIVVRNLSNIAGALLFGFLAFAFFLGGMSDGTWWLIAIGVALGVWTGRLVILLWSLIPLEIEEHRRFLEGSEDPELRDW